MGKNMKGISHGTLAIGALVLIVGTLIFATLLLAQPSPDVSLEIISPNGGEFWGGNQTISWNCTDILQVDIWFSEDGGMTWIPLAQDIASLGPNPHVWPWDTTLVSDTAAGRINISSVSGYGQNSTGAWGYGGEFNPTQYHRISHDNFTVDNTPPSIHAVEASPSPQEAGEYVTLFAHIDDPFGIQEVVLTLTYPDSRMENISLAVNQTGDIYALTQPYFTVGTYNYSFWAADRSGNSQRSLTHSFIILDTTPPRVQILSPLGGERLSGNVAILWKTIDNSDATLNGTIYLQYSDNGGDTWHDLAGKLNNTALYFWNTTSVLDGTQYLVRVNATDAGGNTGYNQTNRTFTIDNTPPFVAMYSPQGGEILPTLITITWSATDTLTAPGNLSIDLAYSPDNGTTWMSIADNITNTGLYGYSTRDWPDGPTYIIQVNATDETGNVGYGRPATVLIKDVTAPFLHLLRPKTGFLYIFNRQIGSLAPLKKAIIIGSLSVECNSHDGTSGLGRIDIHVDDILKETFWEKPYEWTWQDTTGAHTLVAIAYDNAGNHETQICEAITISYPLNLSPMPPEES